MRAPWLHALSVCHCCLPSVVHPPRQMLQCITLVFAAFPPFCTAGQCSFRSCRTRCATRWRGARARECSSENAPGVPGASLSVCIRPASMSVCISNFTCMRWERGLRVLGGHGASARQPGRPASRLGLIRVRPCLPRRRVPLLRELDDKTLYLLASKMTPFRWA